MLKSGVRAGPGGDLASAPTPCRGGWSRAKGWREECGVFAAIGVPSAAQVVGLGLHALQHRGQESAGIVSCGEDGVFHSHKGLGLVSEVFTEARLSRLPGPLAIGHNRYSTSGSVTRSSTASWNRPPSTTPMPTRAVTRDPPVDSFIRRATRIMALSKHAA